MDAVEEHDRETASKQARFGGLMTGCAKAALKQFAFLEPNLSLFRSSEPGRWRAKKAGDWARAVGYHFKGAYSAEELGLPMQRAELVRLRDAGETDLLDLCVFIFAWGGMKTPAGRDLLNSSSTEWICVSRSVREGKISISEGYERYHRLSTSGRLPGCGPAYYTKLLFFLPRSGQDRGVIMDQWTARSINLLTGTQIVSVRGTGRAAWVLPTNDVATYLDFCNAVVALAAKIGASVEETEMRMFSEGGRSPAVWRKHVIEYS